MKKEVVKTGFGSEIPPSIFHVGIYFQQRNLHESEAQLFFEHYAKWNWNNEKGVPIKNWKKEANDWIWARDQFRKFISKCVNVSIINCERHP